MNHDLTEVDFTLRQIATRDLDTDEEQTMWQIESKNMDGVVRQDTPREALEMFAACLETDNERARIELEDLEVEEQPLA